MTSSSTIRLPQSLLDQVNNSNSSNQKFHNSSRRGSSRKATRKQERTVKKQKKAQYFSDAHNATLKRTAEEHPESSKTKKPKIKHAQPKSTESRKTKEPQDQVLHSVPKARSKLEQDEDAYIAYLESKLGIRKSGLKTNNPDDLNDLLNFADSIAQTTSDNTEESYSVIDDTSTETSEEGWNGISTPGDIGAENVIQKTSSPEELVSELMAGRYVPPQMRKLDYDQGTNEAIQKLTKHLKGLLNRMSEQNITTIMSAVEELYRNHRRHDVTSTLANLIINSISSHSSLLDSFVVVYAAFVSGLHKIVGIDFAAYFVQQAVASYEQHYAAMQVPFSQSPNLESSPRGTENQNDGKECSNLLVLVSELYNFQVISSVLVFDIIRAFLDDDLTEFKVELLLKLLRNSGQQLRQDDPSALKDIINIVQEKVASREGAVSSRTTFMIETLTNLKNNKLKRNVTQNQGAPAVERMKKFLSNLGKTRQVLAHEPLRVSLEDLRSANTKGKWWLVGAGWGGDPLVDKQAELDKMEDEPAGMNTKLDESNELARLARAQGMNTEIRRGIFIVLMSSDDYIDACERLMQLNLTEIQQREIVRVLLHCCGNEKPYNPYYTLVCQQLCRTSHAHKITLQYCIWDFLRDIGETKVGGMTVIKHAQDNDNISDAVSITQTRFLNMARAFGWCISKDSVSLLVLKAVDFTILKVRTREFLKEMVIQIFVNSQRSTPLITEDVRSLHFTRNRNALEELFIKASSIQTLAMGLFYFLSEAFRIECDEDHNDEYSKFIRWAVGTAKTTLQTGIDVVGAL